MGLLILKLNYLIILTLLLDYLKKIIIFATRNNKIMTNSNERLF